MRLLSWNVQSCRGLDGRTDPARTAAEAKRLADPDVACFQEVDSDALLHAMPAHEAAWASGVDVPAAQGRYRFGNLVLSRLPIGRILRHSLPWPPAPGVPSMPRVAVEAVIDDLRVITTHLEYYSETHRSAQIARISELQIEASGGRRDGEGPFKSFPRPASAILCGDFNMKPDDPLHEVLARAGFADAWKALHPGKPHPPTFRVHEPQKEPPYCCDYIYVTRDLVPRLRSIRVDADTRASDHQPLVVELA